MLLLAVLVHFDTLLPKSKIVFAVLVNDYGEQLLYLTIPRNHPFRRLGVTINTRNHKKAY